MKTGQSNHLHNIIAKALMLPFCLKLFSGNIAAQDKRPEYVTLLSKGKKEEAYALAHIALLKKNDAGTASLFLGRYHFRNKQTDSAIYYFKNALSLDKDKTWRSAWAHAELGVCLAIQGDYDAANAELWTCIDLNKTKNSRAFASSRLLSVTDPYILAAKFSLKKIESDSIVYFFEKNRKLLKNASAYITLHNSVYQSLSKEFEPVLPRKLSFYVFANKKNAEKKLKRKLGYSLPENAMCFSMRNQTPAHEMAHVLSYWSEGTPCKHSNKFINEGIAVYFDHTSRNKMQEARAVIDRSTSRISVTEYWNSPNAYPTNTLYPVAGAFVEKIHKFLDKKQFRAFIKDQRPETLKQILGARYDQLIAEFNAELYAPE
jgi:tetratricopeptide (TPR) repeat protein